MKLLVVGGITHGFQHAFDAINLQAKLSGEPILTSIHSTYIPGIKPKYKEAP